MPSHASYKRGPSPKTVLSFHRGHPLSCVGCCEHCCALQSHASYGRCGLGSDGTDRIVALVRDEAKAAALRGEAPALFGVKITGGGSGGVHDSLSLCGLLRDS